MFKRKKVKPMVLAVSIILTLATVSVGAISALATPLELVTGQITRISGDAITIDHYKKFEPVNQHTVVPKWAKKGTRVKVGYYTQNSTRYYYEIGKPGETLEIERVMEARRQKDR